MERYGRNTIKKCMKIMACLLIISTFTSLIMSYFVLDKIYTSKALLLTEGEPPIERATSIYSAVAKSDNVIKEVVARIGLDISPRRFKKSIEITSREDMGFIYISAEDSNPEVAHLTVETLIEVMKDEVSHMLPDNRLVIIGEAEMPQEPSRPKPLFNLVIAWAMSISLSILIVLVEQRYSTTIDDIGELKEHKDLQMPIMGVIPHVRGRRRAVALRKSNAVEAFKVFRINIEECCPDKGVTLITSPGIGEGKTTVASSLAISMAKAGEKVILIECDMRRSQIRNIFDIESPYGLSDIFDGKLSLEDAINSTYIANLSIITSGHKIDSPVELFSSQEKMRKFFVIMRSRYDHVIVDTPCVLSVADTPLLSGFVDNIFMVVAHGKTRYEMLIEACEKLHKAGAHISGLVVNCVPISQIPYMKFYI